MERETWEGVWRDETGRTWKHGDRTLTEEGREKKSRCRERQGTGYEEKERGVVERRVWREDGESEGKRVR